MRNAVRVVQSAVSLGALLAALGMAPAPVALAADPAVIAEGKKIAFDRRKGNCLACHQIEDGSLPGNIGPPLVAMKARFPDFDRLRAQINDPRANNPNTIMPPFGPHEILSQEEVDKVAEYIHSL